MDTIGTVLKNARRKKRFSRLRLEKETRIKKEFVRAIEEEKWDQLPELPVVKGFVKNIAKALNINEKRAIALLRRDYPPKAVDINPKKGVFEKFVWSPKLTFLLGVAIIVVAVLGYLSFQYTSFISPPSLEIFGPNKEQVITDTKVNVSGKTDSDATISVNNQPAIVDADGLFEAEIELIEGDQEIIIRATSRGGKETVVRRKIKVEFNN